MTSYLFAWAKLGKTFSNNRHLREAWRRGGTFEEAGPVMIMDTTYTLGFVLV